MAPSFTLAIASIRNPCRQGTGSPPLPYAVVCFACNGLCPSLTASGREHYAQSGDILDPGFCLVCRHFSPYLKGSQLDLQGKPFKML